MDNGAHMGAIDWGVVVIYLAGVAGVGFAVRGKVKGLNDYFAGGHNVPWWLAAISHHISGYSAFAFVAYASLAYKYGITVWTVFAVPVCVSMVIGAYVWAPRWARLNVVTAVEYLERRFNLPTHQVIAWSGIAVKFVDEGLKLYALGIVVHTCTGLPLAATIIGCGVVAILYVLVGGLWAELITDFAQFVIQFVTTIILSTVVLSVVGGFGGLWDGMTDQQRQLFSPEHPPIWVLVFGVVILLSYNGGTWGLAQRFYSVGKASDAKKAALLSAALYLVYPIILYIPCWAAPALLGEVTQPEQTYALMAKHYLPTVAPGLVGLFVASIFAATMSMVDSDLNALAAVFTKDIYQRIFHRRASEARLMKVGLSSTAVFGAITVGTGLLAITPLIKDAFSGMVQWYAALLPAIAIPLLFGMLFKGTTSRGALLACAGGFATMVVLRVIYGSEAFVIYTGGQLIVSFGLFFVDSLLSKHRPADALRIDRLFEQISPERGDGEGR